MQPQPSPRVKVFSHRRRVVLAVPTLLIVTLLAGVVGCSALPWRCKDEPWSNAQPTTTIVVTPEPGSAREGSAVINIRELRYHTACQGQMTYLMGLVENSGTLPARVDAISVTLTDTRESRVKELMVLTPSYVLPPGVSLGFQYAGQTSESPTTILWSSLAASLPKASIADASEVKNSLEVITVTGKAEGSAAYLVSGQLRNIGDTAVNLPVVIITLFDANNRLVGVDWASAKLRIVPPGMTADFEEQATDLAGPVDHFEVYPTY